MPRCRGCGAEVEEGAGTCPDCGAAPSGPAPRAAGTPLDARVAAVAALGMLATVWTTVVQFGRPAAPLDLLFLVLWAAAAVGLRTRSRWGVGLGAVVFGLAAAATAASALVWRVAGVPAAASVGAFDPLSVVLGVVQVLLVGSGRAPVPAPVFGSATVLGVAGSAAIAVVLWRNRAPT